MISPISRGFSQIGFVATLLFLAVLSSLASTTDAFVFNKIQDDFLALTRRVTSRHILVPDEDVARALKQKIRDQCVDKERYVVDVFEEAAKRYSRDESTCENGGLLGELVPQGYCRSRELDRFQFEVPLGELYGPLKTEYGYHLLLVSERTNCPKLDGDCTRLVQTRGDDVFGTLMEGQQVGKANLSQILVDQVQFWALTFVAGGVVAELSEKLVSSL